MKFRKPEELRGCLSFVNFLDKQEIDISCLELRWPGNDLFSRSVARQLSLALVRFTTVFEMGTGGSIPLKLPSHLNFKSAVCSLKTEEKGFRCNTGKVFYQPIRTGKLNTLQRFHSQPINLIVFQGFTPIKSGFIRVLILGCASHLDAFSGYHLGM